MFHENRLQQLLRQTAVAPLVSIASGRAHPSHHCIRSSSCGHRALLIVVPDKDILRRLPDCLECRRCTFLVTIGHSCGRRRQHDAIVAIANEKVVEILLSSCIGLREIWTMFRPTACCRRTVNAWGRLRSDRECRRVDTPACFRVFSKLPAAAGSWWIATRLRQFAGTAVANLRTHGQQQTNAGDRLAGVIYQSVAS